MGMTFIIVRGGKHQHLVSCCFGHYLLGEHSEYCEKKPDDGQEIVDWCPQGWG